MDIGIPDHSMVRLGSKSSSRTKHLGLHEQSRVPGHSNRSYLSAKQGEMNGVVAELESSAHILNSVSVDKDELLEYLEFSTEDNDVDLFDALTVPEEERGMRRVGKGGRSINKYYLWDRWASGRDAGVFKDMVRPEHGHVWRVPTSARKELITKWKETISREACTRLVGLIQEYNGIDRDLQEYNYHHRYSEVLRQKRIIACTTNGAARYASALDVTKPDVLLVEEAGEILESHVLTAMTMDTKQLVLIGDHKQLRPKLNNYSLSVEKGDGFDLNRSLFERLIIRQHPYSSLSKQHRMRPEISRLVRHMTYPELQDANRVRNRPHLRGFQSDVVFVNHSQLESDLPNVRERRDPTAKVSKQNLFEVQMVLGIVRYLGQQGYGTDSIVILTPYLGQLSLLRRELGKTTDPILNDLDSSELIRAGLISPGSTKVTRNAIRISTIGKLQANPSASPQT